MTKYLANQERTKAGVIKDHLLRILELETNNNKELTLELAEMKRAFSDLLRERNELADEVHRLRKMTRNFTVVK